MRRIKYDVTEALVVNARPATAFNTSQSIKTFYQNHRAGQPRLWKYRMRGGERAKQHDEAVSGSKLKTETEVMRKKEMSIAEVGGNRGFH